jgi:hypothetical protein
VRAVPKSCHTFGSKTVPSGFFDLPGAQNVSAVLFSNAGTMAKFDRMGVVAGFIPANHIYLRLGFRYNPDPHATEGVPFSENVSAATYSEFWSDELQLFHNPNAMVPIPPEWLSGLTQHFFKNGDHHSITPESHVLSSITSVISLGDEESG